MSAAARAAAALLPAAYCLAALGWIDARPVEARAGAAGLAPIVRGAAADGTIPTRAFVVLAGIDRRIERRLRIELAPEPGRRVVVGLGVDGAPLVPRTADGSGRIVLALPPAPAPGARVALERPDGAPPPRLRAVRLEPAGARVPAWPAWLAVLAVAAAGFFLPGATAPERASVAAASASLLALLDVPGAAWATLPAASAWGTLAPGLLAAAALVVLAPRCRRGHGRRVALVLGLLFGAWIRLYFLPSAGSWDVEYWKAWTERIRTAGLGRVYGDPGSVPPGHFLAQLAGREPAWMLVSGGRRFGVDYPPLAMASWAAADGLTRALPLGLEEAERRNVAAKLPAVLGDVAALALVAFGACGSRPERRAALAVAYWALPVSWLSSAVLGFQDGAYAPLAALAVLAAGAGRIVTGAALLAVATLLKPLAILVAPVVAVAAVARGVDVRVLARAGLAVAAVALLAAAPFLRAGTVPELAVHLVRAFSPGNLSSGAANPWWIVGHAVRVARGAAAWTDRVDFVRLSEIAFPAAAAGTLVLGAVAVALLRRLRRAGIGPSAALLAAAAIVYAYAILAVGVYENHVHAFFPLALLAGLPTRRWRRWTFVAGAVYVANLLLFSGLGRFYGARYLALEPWAEAVAALRTAAGLDASLLLAVVGTLVLVRLLGAPFGDAEEATRPRPEREGSGSSGPSGAPPRARTP